MTKYVKVSDDHTKLLSALHHQKPRQIKRLPDDVIHHHGWFLVDEHYPTSAQNMNLYSAQMTSWNVNKNRVHVYYEYVLRPVEQRRAYLLTRAHYYRDQMLAKPLFFNGKPFDRDEKSKTRVSGSTVLAVIDPNYSVEWITADNDFMTLVGEDVIKFGKAMGHYESVVVTHGRLLKDQIKTSDAPEEIDLLAGWPSNEYSSEDFA